MVRPPWTPISSVTGLGAPETREGPKIERGGLSWPTKPTISIAALTAGDNVKDTPCSDIVGAKQAAIYVQQCLAVAPETHPPCNAQNSCELIVSHNMYRCSELGGEAPKFCAAYFNRK